MVGYWLDGKLGTRPVFFLVGAVFGLVAALYHFFKTVSEPQAVTPRYDTRVVVLAVVRRLASPGRGRSCRAATARGRAAAAFGAALAAANTLAAYGLVLWSAGRSTDGVHGRGAGRDGRDGWR